MFVDIISSITKKKMVYKNPKFDLNKKPNDFYCNDELDKDSQFDDTTLRLECFSQQGTKSLPSDGCGLVLGLGPTPSVCSNDRDLVLKLGVSDQSTASKSDLSSCFNGFGFRHVVDEGSTSAKRSGGYMPSLLLAPRISVPLQKVLVSEPDPSIVSGFLAETASDQQTSSKKYEFLQGGVRCSHSTGCSKGTRGESGLWIKHGGGKRSVVDGWTRSAGEVGLCTSHGGGRRCGFRGCKMGAQVSSMFCRVHSGGKRLCVAKENKSGVLGISPQLSHGLVSGPGPGPHDNLSLSCSSTVSNSTSWLGKPAKRRQLIPPQVLVPSSMKSSSLLPFSKQSSSTTDNNGGPRSSGLVAPEGRVHGGSLLSLVNGNLNHIMGCNCINCMIVSKN